MSENSATPKKQVFYLLNIEKGNRINVPFDNEVEVMQLLTKAIEEHNAVVTDPELKMDISRFAIVEAFEDE